MWDALGRQVAGRNYPPTNKNTLIRALTEEWDKLPQHLLDNVVQSGAETSKNITARVIERVVGGPLHRFLEESRGFSELTNLVTNDAKMVAKVAKNDAN
ncbi:hypothetical protein TNCV_780811 [Trichonephila clavipes]|nr:hypothetical protein TNCV_780811 [Trichonephila clavipes]